MRLTLAFMVLAIAGVLYGADQSSKPKENQNSLISEYKDKLVFSASTEWPGWPASRAFDGDAKTSWFTAGKDAAAHQTTPWIMVAFPDDVTVRRVTILGNLHQDVELGRTAREAIFDFIEKIVG